MSKAGIFDIIDFHTHPFLTSQTNICNYPEANDMSPQYTKELMTHLGVSRICGSVVQVDSHPEGDLGKIRDNNNEALKLWEIYGDFYVPGFHIHPHYLTESLEEIERMHKLGVNLIGELPSYCYGWGDVSDKNFYELMELANQYDMVVSLDTSSIEEQGKLAAAFPHLKIVAAHPGEPWTFKDHIECMKNCDNYYLDLAGYGVFRHGMLKYGIDLFGAERFIFGSDYPTCNPAMYIGAVTLDPSIKDSDKEKILSLNAKRLLNIK